MLITIRFALHGFFGILLLLHNKNSVYKAETNQERVLVTFLDLT